MLTEAERTACSSLAESTLVDTASIKRSTQTKKAGTLDLVESIETIATSPCRVFELGVSRGNRDAEVGGNLTSQGDYTVRFPLDTNVLEGDTLEVTTSGRSRALHVARIIEHSYATLLTCVCSEVRSGTIADGAGANHLVGGG